MMSLRATEVKRLLAGSALIVLVGVAATLSAWWVARRLSAEQRAAEFERESAEVQNAVVSQLEDALWTLEAIAALWDASKEVEAEEFHAFVRPFLEGRPQIEALEWAPRVPRAELATFEERARALHGPGFFVYERAPDQTPIPVAPRETYVPVLFVEGRDEIERSAGFDLASEPARRATLEAARGLGTTRMTPPVTLIQDVPGRTGLLAMYPVYRQRAEAGRQVPRRERLLGFAVGVFRVDEVIELGISRLHPPIVDFTIHAATPDGDRLVYRHGPERDDAVRDGLTSSTTVQVGGADWVIAYDDARYHAAMRRTSLAPWILAAGALVTGAVLLAFGRRERRLTELAEANRNLEHEVQERRRAERERERMQQQVIETQKLESLGILAGGIAHDFNNILTAVLGNAGLALHEAPPGSTAARALERVVSASERASLLTRQLLAYAGKGAYRVQPLDLSALVRGIAPLLEASAPKKVELVFDLAADLPPVAADEAQMHQVVLNLVMNGAEACGENPGRVVVTTRALGDPAPGRVVLEVTDDGCGMDEATQARIFDPFFTTKFTGRGLGLAAVLGIVRAHGASLEVRSKRGAGSTFRLVLPATDGPAVPVNLGSPPRPGVTAGPGRSVLVVDDEPMVLEIAQATLELAGHRVIVASNGRQAIAAFHEHVGAIDLVVLDMTMPEMNGEETLRALRRIRPDVTVLLSSGYAEDDIVPTFEEHSLAGFLQKPWMPKDLLAKVSEILDRAP